MAWTSTEEEETARKAYSDCMRTTRMAVASAIQVACVRVEDLCRSKERAQLDAATALLEAVAKAAETLRPGNVSNMSNAFIGDPGKR